MKKLCAVVIFLSLAFVVAAVWYSPLCSIGDPVEYRQNAPVAEIDGVCYSSDGSYRVDFCGGVPEMEAALRKIGAAEVKRVTMDGITLVYAYSPRVTGYLRMDGARYNVMAAASNGTVSIGTPALQGCY